jgi:hypothetical protein
MKVLATTLLALFASFAAGKKGKGKGKSKDDNSVKYGVKSKMYSVGGPSDTAIGFHLGEACVQNALDCKDFAYRSDFRLEFDDGLGDCLSIHRPYKGQIWHFLRIPNSHHEEYVVQNPATMRVLEYDGTNPTNMIKACQLEGHNEDPELLFKIDDDDFFDCDHAIIF